ncbi:hypothetical protein [Streptomyces sp. NPDC094472]|uniref:hypothetical protein n=1 Tax=unclassified Streptomyces TaxID=2593676 RepID=UPI00331C2C63
MAEDHRYSWLDDSAAERLLRGEPVEGQPGAPDGRGDESYAEAERLAAVLSAVAGAGRPAAPSDASALPGEEAAMAAFRAARVEAEADAVAEPGVTRRPQRIRQFRERQPRLRRPLRAGMIAMVAGCALGGFAVAAAAGVLPTPFGPSHHTPGPSVSMSDAGPGGESAHPDISEDGGTTAPGPSGSGDNDASDVGSNGAQGGTVTSDPGGGDKGKEGDASSKGKHSTPRWALRVCPRYLAAELAGVDLDKKSLKKLTKAAGSASAIHGYCTQILADDSTDTPRSDDSGESTDNGGGDNSTDSGSDNGGGIGGSDGSGSGDGGGSDSGGDSGGDSGKGGGDDTTVPQPPPPPGDTTGTTGTPSATTTPTPADDSTASTDPVTATETGAD